MSKFKVVTHFYNDDEDCSGDYLSVTIHDENNNKIAEFGDYYHDKGDEKAEGFLEGLKYALGGIEVEYEDVADGEY